MCYTFTVTVSDPTLSSAELRPSCNTDLRMFGTFTEKFFAPSIVGHVGPGGHIWPLIWGPTSAEWPLELGPTHLWHHLWPLGLCRWVAYHRHTYTSTKANMMLDLLYHLSDSLNLYVFKASRWVILFFVCLSSQRSTPALLWLVALGQPLPHPPTRPILGLHAPTHAQTPGKQGHLPPPVLSITSGTVQQMEVPFRNTSLIKINIHSISVVFNVCPKNLRLCCFQYDMQAVMGRIRSLQRKRRSPNKRFLKCPPLNLLVPQVV